jgi:hypothetical protein
LPFLNRQPKPKTIKMMKMKTTIALSCLALSAISAQAALVHAGGSVTEITATNDIWTPSNISDGTNGNGSRFVTLTEGELPSVDYFLAGTIPVFEIDLGSSMSIDGVALWSYFSEANGNSTSSFEVSFSDTSGVFAGTAYTFAPTNVANSIQQDFSLGETATGQYVQLRLLDNFSGDRVGLSELQFNAVAVPEPSSTALLGLGGLALILRRRK